MCVPSCACRPSVRKSLSCSSRYTCWTSLASLISKLPTRVPLYCATCVCPTRLSCVTIDVRLGVRCRWLWCAGVALPRALRRLSHSTPVCPLSGPRSRTRRPISVAFPPRAARASLLSQRGRASRVEQSSESRFCVAYAYSFVCVCVCVCGMCVKCCGCVRRDAY